MAISTLHKAFLLLSLSLVPFCIPKTSFALSMKQFILSRTAIQWSSAGATWYGSPYGAGHFLKVKCRGHRSCSHKPVRVTITDFCPGGPCVSESAHFDLSGTAFGAMAIRGQENQLRNAGVLSIQFARVACYYGRTTVAFHVDPASNPYYISIVVEFEDGDGDLAGVSLQDASSTNWQAMQQSWGAEWKLDAKLWATFSILLTSKYSGRNLVARNVIPAGWKPGTTYRSFVNYL
ncbi:hypothetical protein GIB67_016364 [Kingdonia uniflora]|uniref:Uncharacterized protein n=1 Tax=Kingdonia uniflora TaxID=39325 RepID=A0A7J7PC67_9MAGN|nr:hypothetical protein GIB67_016364 [Kingdonia uniflora]